jgi:two-component system, sensor histidine kinase RpfC
MDQFYKRLYSSWIRPLQLRLRGAGNGELSRERNQAIVRLTVQLAVLVYFIVREVPLHFSFFAFIGAGVAILILVYLATAASVLRRTVTNVFDVAMTSFVMVYVGQAAVPLFLLYLWITLGNGLRFGLRAMAISAALSFLGFSVVLGLSPIWQGLVPVALAVMAALLVLPLTAPYIRSLALRRQQAATHQDSFLVDRVPHDAQPPPHLLGRERSQAITRLVISAVVTVYLVISFQPVSLLTIWFLFCLGYLVFSVLIVTLALHDTEHSVPRRTISNVADAGAISYLMVATGQMGFPLFVLYLWITLGNGFRYGITAMLVSSALSVAGFSVVVAVSELWREHHMLAAGVLTGLIVIPGYAAHLIRHLHDARQRAEEASTAKSHFLARMSHELRTPLNGILGTAELLGASKRLTREDRSLLDVIKDSVQVSMRQIDNVLDFSKIEAGKLVIEQVDFDMHELLNRATRLVRAIALDKNLRLTLRIDPAMPYRLVGDPHHLHEVLLNLLSNAIKFTEKGYVSLEAHLLEADNNSALIRFEAYDTGIGIEQAALDRIFEAFTQEDTATTRRYGGTGLGTTIAKQLVELMGGELRAESVKGQGSRFHADIRFARQPEAKTAAGDGGFAGMQALLISDDSQLGGRLGSLLEEWGVALTVAASVPEALGLLARSIRMGNPVHAVLADSHVVYADSGVHCADDFLDKAALSLTPVFMIADVSPDQAELRQWGYTAVVSYDLPRALLYNALRSARVYDSSGSERGVLQIEPWAWGQPGRIRPKLLVADDNRTNLMILRKILEAANYEVDTAENGEQALELLLRGRYKAAILDMHMPGLDGVAVIKQYRVLRAGVRVPIIMLTANATLDAKLQSAEAGADAYLTKPATSGEVLSTIKKLVDDTEIQTLPNARAHTSAVLEPAVLDKQVIMELDRLYGSPPEVSRLLDTFELEGRRLLHDLDAAIANKNHAAFCDLIHALKGNGANVGATRLVQACREVESCGMLDFRRDGKQMLARLEAAFAEASTALREFTAIGETNPARGTDLH